LKSPRRVLISISDSIQLLVTISWPGFRLCIATSSLQTSSSTLAGTSNCATLASHASWKSR
jgi:hypothetical protein